MEVLEPSTLYARMERGFRIASCSGIRQKPGLGAQFSQIAILHSIIFDRLVWPEG
jgi:hypothetical protein